MPVQKRILIVDDEPDAVEFVKAMLSEINGVTTMSAGDGDAGLATAKQAKPDLIILDVQMPRKDGFTVFAELKADPDTKAIPVIMLTGVTRKTGISFSAADMGEMLGAKPSAYIEKPVDPDRLQKTVKTVLGL
jgi:CheY-like chemotaxis protein